MASLPNQPLLTPEEYLAIERKAEYRSEYVDGQMFAMSGASGEHNQITGNVYASLKHQLRGGSSRPFILDVRVRAKQVGPYYYPDVVGWLAVHRSLRMENSTPS